MESLEFKKKIVIMLAVMSAMLFAALNQTIVGTALPKIISELHGINYYSWVFTMFMLASSVTAILVGKLSDIYGRKIFILVGIGIFTLGSFLCGLSDTMVQLIIFRGIQGFGAGMIMSTSFTVVGDLFSPRERGKWQGLMTSIFGVSSLIGPTLGGWIVDNADWHWVFWVFLPVGVIAFLMILIIYPSHTVKTKEPIDYFGSLFISLTIIPLLLALTWGGNEYAWSSTPIVTLFIFAFIAFFFFFYTEKRVASPVLPLDLFKNKIFTISNIVNLIIGIGMFGTIMYMPFFIQGALGSSATKSGLIMMPMTFCMVCASAICGQLISKTGKYKIFVILGLLVMGTGMFSLSLMDLHTTSIRAVINIIIVGVGIGLCLPVVTLAVQNAVSQKLLGVATSSVQLFRQLGGTVGVAILGSIMNMSLQKRMSDLTSNAEVGVQIAQNPSLGQLQDPQILMNHDELTNIRESLAPELQDTMSSMIAMAREALSYSLTNVFFIASIILCIGFLLTFLLKEIPLRLSNNAKEEETPAPSTCHKKETSAFSNQ